MNLEGMHGGGIGPQGLEPFARDIEAKTKRAAVLAMSKKYHGHLKEARRLANQAHLATDLKEIEKFARKAQGAGAIAFGLFMAIRIVSGLPYRGLKL